MPICRYLTSLQMIQFVCVFLHAVQPLYLDCDYPKLVPKVNTKLGGGEPLIF